MPIPTPPLVDMHWRARLADVQDLLLVAHEVDDVVKALIALTNLLSDEYTQQRDLPILLALVRDAHRLFNKDLEKLSWRDDVKDWTHAARPFVQS